MKRLALVAAVLAFTACSKAEVATDTATPAMAPAPAPAVDTSHAKMVADSIARADSIRRADSVAKASKKP
jgi:uncharacterized lipoprotein YajG